jgi:hypothetical protein
MAVNSSDFGRYANPGGRPYYPQRSTTPDIEFSESERPAVPLVPAPYLPAGRFDEHKRANIVLSAGTPVALDAAGAMIPAGTPVGHAFKYSSLDYTTGLPAARRADTGAVVTSSNTTALVMHSGLGYYRNGFFLQPVGITSYNAYQYEGGVVFSTWPSYTVDYDNPAKFPIHNTQAQPETLVAITCDYVIEVPYIYGRNMLSDYVKVFDNAAAEIAVISSRAKSFPFAYDELIRNAGTAVFGSGISLVFISPQCGTGISGYSSSGVLTGVSGAARLAVGDGGSVGTAVDITSQGYHILYDATYPEKYMVVFTDTTKTSVAGGGFTTGTITFKAQDPIQPGDFIACRLGKFVKWDYTRMLDAERVGQVLRVRSSAIKRDYLDRVKTAYERSADAAGRMAGSATRGVPYLISLVTDAAQVIFETGKQLSGTALTDTTYGLVTLPLGSVVINLLR